MDSTLTIALAVSGLGLLILFAALAFLYGLMYAMTALSKDRPSAQQEEPVLELVALLGEKMYESGHRCDIDKLLPLYLRQAEAIEKRKCKK